MVNGRVVDILPRWTQEPSGETEALYVVYSFLSENTLKNGSVGAPGTNVVTEVWRHTKGLWCPVSAGAMPFSVTAVQQVAPSGRVKQASSKDPIRMIVGTADGAVGEIAFVDNDPHGGQELRRVDLCAGRRHRIVLHAASSANEPRGRRGDGSQGCKHPAACWYRSRRQPVERHQACLRMGQRWLSRYIQRGRKRRLHKQAAANAVGGRIRHHPAFVQRQLPFPAVYWPVAGGVRKSRQRGSGAGRQGAKRRHLQQRQHHAGRVICRWAVADSHCVMDFKGLPLCRGRAVR